MRLIVLGSAAGGGFPQWNCGCAQCGRARTGELEARTQDSVAVTTDTGENARFALINASPDILEQIKKTRALWPRTPRHTPIGAIVLTNGDMDHILGLFSLRESQPLAIYATHAVWTGLERSVLFRTLQRFEGHTVFRPLSLGARTVLADAAGNSLGIGVRALAAPGKAPVHLTGVTPHSPEDNVALSIDDASGQGSDARVLYAAACAHVAGLELAGHDTILFDGTFFHEDELVRLGLSKSLAKDMAHMPIAGDKGSLEMLRSVPARKIYTHVNNTNPILDPQSQARRAVEAAGFAIAHDGMEIDIR